MNVTQLNNCTTMTREGRNDRFFHEKKYRSRGGPFVHPTLLGNTNTEESAALVQIAPSLCHKVIKAPSQIAPRAGDRGVSRPNGDDRWRLIIDGQYIGDGNQAIKQSAVACNLTRNRRVIRQRTFTSRWKILAKCRGILINVEIMQVTVNLLFNTWRWSYPATLQKVCCCVEMKFSKCNGRSCAHRHHISGGKKLKKKCWGSSKKQLPFNPPPQ